MRRLVLLAALLSIALSAFAARRITVAELQQILAAEHAANKTDADSAQQLGALELTEQLTEPTLQRLAADANPGPKTAQVLLLLADSSALLAPPAAEIPATPKPGMAAQRAMFVASVNYAAGTLQHLPDFLAARVTHSFDDTPLVIGESGYAPVTQLHLVGTFTRQITYRNGREVLESEAPASAGKRKPAPAPEGLATWGEFGPVLAIVLSDVMKGRVTWSRWQQSPAGQLAVFQYAVPKAASHYRVDYCCSWDTGPVAYHDKPGYHGELYLDPANGTVRRLTLAAELNESDAVSHASIDVRYGPVEIDGKSYICPTRGIAISVDRNRGAKVIGGEAKVRRVNEITFTDFHKFGSTARIFAGSPESQAPPSPNASPAANASQASATSIDSPTPEPPAPNADATATSATAAPTADLTAAVPPSAAPPAPAEASTNSQQESVLRTMPIYKTNTREVIIDVVVTRANGDPVLGLSQQDFAIKEDGKPQSIGFFEEHTAKTLPPAAQQPLPKLPPNIFTNTPPAPESDSVNVLLLDSMNTPPPMISYARNQILGYLNNVKPGTRMAIVVLNDKLNFVQGFTTDAALLREVALKQTAPGISPSLVTRSEIGAEQELESFMESNAPASPGGAKAGGSTANGNSAGAPMIATTAVAAAFASYQSHKAANRTRMTLEAISDIARYLAAVPGRKNLIWFAGDFPVVIFPKFDQRMEDEDNAITLREVRNAANLLTTARVAVYPVYANGMMSDDIVSSDNRSPGSAAGPGRMSSMTGMDNYTASHDERAGLIAAMNQIASDTGGKAVYNTNDLNGAAQRAMNDGANYYTLTYSPTNQKMDGQYRHIALQLTNGHYKLSYRRGYNTDKPPALQSVSASGVESKTSSDPNRPAVKDGADATAHADPLRPLLKFGLPSATSLLYGVRVLPASPQPSPNATRAGQNPDLKGPFTRYNVDFFIRWTDVAFQSDPNGTHTGRVEVGLMAFDRNGKAVNWEGGTQAMNVAPETFNAIQKSGVPAHMEIDLPDKDVFLVTGVYDLNTGKAGTLEIPMNSVAQDRTPQGSN